MMKSEEPHLAYAEEKVRAERRGGKHRMNGLETIEQKMDRWERLIEEEDSRSVAIGTKAQAVIEFLRYAGRPVRLKTIALAIQQKPTVASNVIFNLRHQGIVVSTRRGFWALRDEEVG